LSGIVVADCGGISEMDQLGQLPVPKRAIACRVKAGQLLSRAERVAPEIAGELRTIALQWLMLARQIESKAGRI
jgi:hypothetical protein